MKQKTSIAAALALVIGLAACNREEISNLPEVKTGVTVTAGIENGAGTRISYEDVGTSTKVLWDAAEHFYIKSTSLGSDPIKFVKQGTNAGVATASFREDGTTIDESKLNQISGAVYYKGAAVNANASNITVDFSTQDGTGSDKQIMVASKSFKGNGDETLENLDFTFKAQTPLLKLTLKNDAFKTNPLTDIKLSGLKLAASAKYTFSSKAWGSATIGDITITGTHAGDASTGEVILYVAQPTCLTMTDPITITGKCNGADYFVSLRPGWISTASVYKAELGMLEVGKSMQLTINPGSGGGKYKLPFTGNLAAGVKITIDWGYGSGKTEITGTGGTVTAESPSYPAMIHRAITITSSAAATGQQIPKLEFGGDSPNVWLASMDTPMLNMNATDMSSTFYKCTALKSIAAGLLRYNTEVEDLGSCFAGCSGLTTIPAGLFDTNTKVTNFYGCFSSCTNLASVPRLLFKNNTVATEFTSTFANCTKLVLNSDIFCDEAAGEGDTRFLNKTIYFGSCFNKVGDELASGAGGVAPALWNYNFGSGTPTPDGCFTGCSKVTNVNDIYASWGGPKTGF